MGWGNRGYPRYVSVGERKAKARRKIAALRKQGKTLHPVTIEGRTIARTFWGKSWCDNVESYSDRYNRLSRGRSYVRSGTVIDLHLDGGELQAMVMGSSLYHIQVHIEPMAPRAWSTLTEVCRGQIDSLVDLLQGKFPKAIMEAVCQQEGGLFPLQDEISLKCSCPDGARLCKHLAAVLYAIGARLDEEPGLLFTLRQVDSSQLLATDFVELGSAPDEDDLADEDLEALFGIELEMDEVFEAPPLTEPSSTDFRERADDLWLDVCELLPERNRRAYKKAAQMLLELQQLYTTHRSLQDFLDALQPVLQLHRRKRSLFDELQSVGIKL